MKTTIYVVEITEFCKLYNGGEFTERKYFNNADNARKFATSKAKELCGRSELKDHTMGSGDNRSLSLHANGYGYHVAVREIETED